MVVVLDPSSLPSLSGAQERAYSGRRRRRKAWCLVNEGNTYTCTYYQYQER